MCSLTLGLMAVQMGTQLYAQNKQAHAERDALRYQQEAAMKQYELQKQQAQQNQAIQEHKADTDAENFAKKQQQLNDKHRLIAGQIASQAGGSGLSLSGSVRDAMDASDLAYENDTKNLLGSQREKAFSNYVQWANYKNEENAAVANYNNANNYYNQMIQNNKAQARLNTFGTLLNGFSSMYGQGYKEGLWGNSKKKA